jgi:3-hydroxymyristoyl/3-hydroxydecanoyl-(acyl carrier protein) dehydratase
MKAGNASPQLLSEERTGATWLRRSLYLPRDLSWFDGHFPQEAILAGVVQIKWAIEAAAELRGDGARPASIQQLKFKAPIRPEMTLELTLDRQGESLIVFSYTSAAGMHSVGRFQYPSG